MELVEDYVGIRSVEIPVHLDKLMTVIEYAQKINKSRQWVYKLIQSRDIKVVKVGGKNYILPTD